MNTMKRPLSLLLLLLAVLPASGCTVVHRYPAYRGTVLELGTDKPIEGAGVLAVYYKWQSGLEAIHNYMSYQAVLTDNTGKFTIPSKYYFTFTPMSWFDPEPLITIYKRGYGNFPGSLSERRPKHVKTEPGIGAYLPPDNVVTFWLPKLETEEERNEHNRLFSVTSSILDDGYPPPGTIREQFEPVGY